MKIFRNHLLPLMLVSALWLPGSVHAQSSQRFGDYEVHYNALSMASLGADMARKYDITRSSRNGMLNIAVRNIADSSNDTAVRAEISGSAVNLTGQKSNIAFREIDGSEVSYIGQFAVKGPDTYTFDLSIQPEGAARPFTLRFNQNFSGD